MTEAYFITGTDTGVGKTLVAGAMLLAAARMGKRTVGLKPIASGAQHTAAGLRNEDALALVAAMSEQLAYEEVNPVVLQPAIAPHLALREAGISLDVDRLHQLCAPALGHDTDFLVVEGAGGWRVPLNEQQTLADFACRLQLPVVLVVGMRLGCINHALLSAQAIRSDGLKLAGWVANQIDADQPHAEQNFQTLESWLQAPCIGRIPFLRNASHAEVAAMLDLRVLRAML